MVVPGVVRARRFSASNAADDAPSNTTWEIHLVGNFWRHLPAPNRWQLEASPCGTPAPAVGAELQSPRASWLGGRARTRLSNALNAQQSREYRQTPRSGTGHPPRRQPGQLGTGSVKSERVLRIRPECMDAMSW